MARPKRWDREPTDAELKSEEAELERLIRENLATMPGPDRPARPSKSVPGIRKIKHKMRRSKGPRGA